MLRGWWRSLFLLKPHARPAHKSFGPLFPCKGAYAKKAHGSCIFYVEKTNFEIICTYWYIAVGLTKDEGGERGQPLFAIEGSKYFWQELHVSTK